MNAPAYDWDQLRLNRIRTAQVGSELATARLQGMKLRAELDPPRPAQGKFPYPARTCAEWTPLIAKIERRSGK
jgi:hypothetical protein